DSKATQVTALRGYYELTKPGITQMVVLTAAVGYYVAFPPGVPFASVDNLVRFVYLILGTALISGGSCAFNHILERADDATMKRTGQRPIPSGLISVRSAAVFATLCSVLGLLLLTLINTVTMVLAAATFLAYLAVYTPLKKKTWLAMFVGGIPGALPAVGGWTAVTGQIGPVALVLFGIMFVWQIPHFLALAMMYRQDYDRGGFALLRKDESGQHVVAKHALAYTIVLVPLGMALTFLGSVGALYLVGCSVLSVAFVKKAVDVVREPVPMMARRLLLASYAYVMGVFLLMVIDKV
ncbi:MAG: heme o synthase, partial [Candidatus Kapaibacterium sp.]